MHQNSNSWLLKEGLRMGHLNINHAVNKLADIQSILCNSGKNFHIFGFSESRLTEHISDSDMFVPGYNILRNDPKIQKETGLLVYVNKCVNIKRIAYLENFSIECIWLEISIKKTKPVLVGFIYRNPSELVDWIDRFERMMDAVANEMKETIILGDFNIDLLKPNKRWTQIYELNNLHQVIEFPTRVTPTSKTLIDHIYVSDKNNIVETNVPACGSSDHFPICMTWSRKGVKLPKAGHKTVTYRCFSKFDKDLFLLDLMNSSLSLVYQFTDPEVALEVWHKIFIDIYNKHAPFVTKRVRQTPKPQWLTDEIQNEIYLRDYLSKHGNKEDYKKQRNKVTSLLRSSKKRYFQSLVANTKDSKSIWKAINNLTNKNKMDTSTLMRDITADDLNKHFTTVTDKIISTDKTESNDLNLLKHFCQSKSINSDLNIPHVTTYEVYKALLSLKQTGTRGLDCLDGKILKLAAPVITDTLTYIYNLCLDKLYFPRAFKQAKVIPLYKSGSPSDPSNYRPISILSVLSKPLEKHINKHIISHFNRYDLLHPSQSGFRKNHSCHTALTNLVDQWLTNINKNEFSGVLFVDFAKAFDCIDHNLLVKKLTCYRLSSNTLKLISSFLSDRQQVIFSQASSSDSLPIKYGVPQGSVLGPLLFSIYINDLPLFIKALCDLFADDTTIHTHHSDLNQVSNTLQQSIDSLVEWTELNHMALNPDKTKYMIVTTRQKRQNLLVNPRRLHIAGIDVEEVDRHKVLGVIIDNNLSWYDHVTSLCKIVSQKIFQLTKIKHFLDHHSKKVFFHAHIQSIINYASTLWDNASANTLKPLKSLYKRAVKLVINKSTSLSTLDYKTLNVLPLNLTLTYNKGIMMHNIMTGCAPLYLTAKFPINRARNSNSISIPLPRLDLYKSSLIYSGGTLWNSLPKHLKEIKNYKSFKRNYFKYLMMTFLD